MKYTRFALILGLATVAVPWAASAQDVTWTYRPPAGGWVGITVDFTLTSTEGQEATLVVIKEVAKGSPAEEAGIRAGDVIQYLDGVPVSQKLFSSLPERLNPGDLVRITVDRQGRSHEFLVEAGKRPSSLIVVGPDAERMVVELETLSGNILKNLDSLRLSIAGLHLDSASGDVSLHLLRLPTPSDPEGRLGLQYRLWEPFSDTLLFEPENLVFAPEFAMPFEALIFESQATAPLKEELAQLRKELTAVRRDQLARQRELTAAIPTVTEEEIHRDDRIRDLRAHEAELLAEHAEMTARLRQVSEEEMRRQWMEVQARSEAALTEARRSQAAAVEEAQRYRETRRDQAVEGYEALAERLGSPVLVGQSFMLGAQLAPLTPELAEYFPVDEGVFVVQVMEGTPAADAGLKGGDIIVGVAGEEVTSLSELRFGLGAFEGPLQIRVIRKGNPVEILIRR